VSGPVTAGSRQASDITRPQTSTRDLAALRARLEGWLAGRLPPGADPAISELVVPSGTGMSSETVIFDATWAERDGRQTQALVARVAPDAAAVPVFRRYDMRSQFRTMARVREKTSLPVPRVLWSEPDAGPLGAPFFVMERIEGRAPPDIMPYNFGSWLSEASAADQARLQAASVGVLAELHGIEHAERDFAFLDDAAPPGPTALARHFADQRAYYDWVVADGLRSPLIERAFAWLEERWPVEEGPAVLSWGDARIGNILFRDFTPVAVLDWEMAALAPREVDLGWFIFLHRFFEDIAAQYGLPGMPDFLRRDDVAAAYENKTGHTPRDLDWYTAYAALRHGIIMFRIARRSIHFGEAVMPADVDDMITHRGAIERMLEDTYWSGLGLA